MRLVAAVPLLFAASIASAQTRMGPGGIPEGQPFEDTCDNPTAVVVRSGWWIDGVQLECGGSRMTWRGGTGGSELVFRLQPGERIVAIGGSAIGAEGNYVYSIRIETDRRSSPVFGNGGPNPGMRTFRWEVPAGQQFRGIYGTTGDFLNSFGMITGSAQAAQALPLPTAARKTPSPAPAAPAMPAAEAASLTPTPIPGSGGGSGTGLGAACPSGGRRCQTMAAGDMWEGARGGAVPAGAMSIGRAGTLALYSCEAYFRASQPYMEYARGRGVLTPGSGCQVVMDGQAVSAPEYQVLMGLPSTRTVVWGRQSGGAYNLDGIGVCRGTYQGNIIPGAIKDDNAGCRIVVGGRVVTLAEYETLLAAPVGGR